MTFLRLIFITLILSSCASNRSMENIINRDPAAETTCFDLMSSFSNPVNDILGAKKISKLVAELQTNKGLSIEDREYLIQVLHPETRTNIGGSISELSDQEFNELLSKIKLNNTLSKEEKRILSSMDTEAAPRLRKELKEIIINK